MTNSMILTEDYMEVCRETAIYPEVGEMTEGATNYCIVGLLGEAGELANKWKKQLRGDLQTYVQLEERRLSMLAECGDIAWYLTRLCEELGSNLSTVLGENANKLLSRQTKGTLRGEGDER